MKVIHMFLAKKEIYTHVNINKNVSTYNIFFSFKHKPSMHNLLEFTQQIKFFIIIFAYTKQFRKFIYEKL